MLWTFCLKSLKKLGLFTPMLLRLSKTKLNVLLVLEMKEPNDVFVKLKRLTYMFYHSFLRIYFCYEVTSLSIVTK